MSTNLFWRPIPSDGNCIGKSIKYAIAPELWGHDGTLSEGWTTINETFIPFLKGIASHGNKEIVDEANKLIKLIEKYGEIEIALLG